MKIYKKHIIAVLFLIVLGNAGNAMAWTYETDTAITAVEITSPNDTATVYAGGNYTATCTTSTDRDRCIESPYDYVWDTVVHTWSGPGTFGPITGTSTTWTAPAAAGQATIIVTAGDNTSPVYANDADVNDSITVTVVYDYAFSVLDDSDTNMAIFDNLGNLFLKGTMDQNSTHTATAVDEFIIEDSSNSELAIIDANDGNM